MTTNQFPTFAAGGGANTISADVLNAKTTLMANGFPSGKAVPGVDFNSLQRRSLFVAAAIAKLMENSGFDALDNGDLTSFVSNLEASIISIGNSNETGKRVSFLRSTAPTGYIAADGGTIGAPSSGATNRANADTWPLYQLWWDEFDNAMLHIQDSSGTPTTRGSTALADWSANKRLPTFDYRGVFGRGVDNGASRDYGRTLGSLQLDAFASHSHQIKTVNDLENTNLGYIGESGQNADLSTTRCRTELTGENETRPINIAELMCVKL